MEKNNKDSFKSRQRIKAINIRMQRLPKVADFKHNVDNRNLKLAMQKLAKVLNKKSVCVLPKLRWKVSNDDCRYTISLVSKSYGDLVDLDTMPKMMSALEMIGVMDSTAKGYNYLRDNDALCAATGLSYSVDVVCDDSDSSNPVRTVPEITGKNIDGISQTIINAEKYFGAAIDKAFDTNVKTRDSITSDLKKIRIPYSRENYR